MLYEVITGLKDTVILADQLMYTGYHYATRSGISIGVNDMIVPEEKADLIKAAESEIKDIGVLTEFVRQGLNRTIYNLYRDDQGRVSAITLAPDVERTIMEVIQSSVNRNNFV